MKHTSFLMLSILFLTACTNHEDYVNNRLTNENDEKPPTQYEIQIVTSQELQDIEYQNQSNEDSSYLDFRGYLKPQSTIASFIGDGDEFANFQERTTSLSKEYVATIISNSSVNTLKIYRILDDRIEIIVDEKVDKKIEDIDHYEYPNVANLKDLPPLEIYLSGPIEVGTTFGEWTIVEKGITLQTPYQSFENVIVTEAKIDDLIHRKYFAYHYGVVKTESILETETNEYFIISSTIEDIWN